MTSPVASPRFFDELTAFSRFSDFANPEHFSKVPKGWQVVITDVVNSTKALDDGRYKDVNTLGAASISVVLEELQYDVPYAFGGDGASLLVSETNLPVVLSALRGLRRLAHDRFGLELRVGHVSIDEINRADAEIEVAKFELASGKYIAVFRGGGMALADQLIKSEDQYTDLDQDGGETVLTGLSCRWNPIPSRNDDVMALMIRARRPGSEETYQAVFKQLDEIFDGNLENANPVNVESMSYQGLREIFANELRYHSSPWSFAFLARAAEILLAVAIFKFKLPQPILEREQYAKSMRIHSDHRKFDDTLRMILDCTAAQTAAIEKFLKQMRNEGKLDFGIHLSKTALMTCHVKTIEDGGHIHFIDGADGGYALAAKQLKLQLAEL